MTAIALAAHVFCTGAMAGLIWFVQIVHYPLFSRIPADSFITYESEHQRRTGRVVAPLMLVELGSGTWLAIHPPAALTGGWAWINMVALIAIWGSTFLIQVLLHQRLAVAFDATAHAQLVATNWIRTVLWNARFLLLITLITV